MIRVHVSDVWNLRKGHHDFEFVDIAVNDDTKLFIDPCLIRKSKRDYCVRANAEIESFFDSFYEAYKTQNIIRKQNLLSHAGEQNATKLGYGNGFNGKGNTRDGILQDFKPLDELMVKIPNISKPEDLTVLLPGFAEDGLSDFLTNIIHEELSDFTLSQMQKYGITPNGKAIFYSWNGEESKWEQVEKPAFFYNGKELLLLPKEVVRKNYLFSTSQYFLRVILEHLREDGDYRDVEGNPIPKKDVMKHLQNLSKEEHWIYNKTIQCTSAKNSYLDEYHARLHGFYYENGDCMTDDELDEAVYYGIDVLTA